MILRGVLARSFGNILCLRGFAPLGDLEELSFPDENYQRNEIKSHSNDIAEFLESGEYTFFPEVILGGSLGGLGFSEEDVMALYQSVDQGEAFPLKNIGDISVSTFVKKDKLLAKRPEFANKCRLRNLSKEDRQMLLMKFPQLRTKNTLRDLVKKVLRLRD